MAFVMVFYTCLALYYSEKLLMEKTFDVLAVSKKFSSAKFKFCYPQKFSSAKFKFCFIFLKCLMFYDAFDTDGDDEETPMIGSLIVLIAGIVSITVVVSVITTVIFCRYRHLF